MKINASILRRLGACEPQLNAFIEAFGEEDAVLSRENAIKYANVFNWDWAGRHLLMATQYKRLSIKIHHTWDVFFATQDQIVDEIAKRTPINQSVYNTVEWFARSKKAVHDRDEKIAIAFYEALT